MGLGASRPPLQRAQLTDQETVQTADLSKMPQLLKAETGQAPQATVLTPRLRSSSSSRERLETESQDMTGRAFAGEGEALPVPWEAGRVRGVGVCLGLEQGWGLSRDARASEAGPGVTLLLSLSCVLCRLLLCPLSGNWGSLHCCPLTLGVWG